MQTVGDGNDEEWLKLCQLAAQEHDPKLRALIAEITRLLAAKEQRPRRNSASASTETEAPDA
jgi:hypothetical protein